MIDVKKWPSMSPTLISRQRSVGYFTTIAVTFIAHVVISFFASLNNFFFWSWTLVNCNVIIKGTVCSKKWI